jgi:FMN phosphatase YigB (HAD superfamily)
MPAPTEIQAIVFDLDSCLSPADEVGRSLHQPLFDALRAANHGTLSEHQLQQVFDATFRFALDDIAERFGLSDEMRRAGEEAFQRLEVRQPMRGYGDLDRLDRLPGQHFLVTSGFRRLQESKIRALGLPAKMTACIVDAVDEPGRKGKEGVFAQIVADHGFAADKVVVVGDNPASEIVAGKKLGMWTVQILRPGVEKGAGADTYVDDLEGLAELLAASSGEEAG